ncbi:EF-P 5-aminopentanol modification-associated protein YfmF [Salisediminibacterium halotolerans]|uniref:EF-P 5-aminopentanol modification-associated protein YfmF n=1 Tax=Salisediminibacterium halotolerans TaxID=517425 RepID=UPI000EAC215B|nr:pitrilysin family protein [Salisediminibacterium halotolerans]RLJ74163.1 putative Zn-dependent peptidase [Actinophytocola xinjiangensis]RPE87744.1 putative Zn-dependent peptidase [Salisediminibacterium halotolerans]TWG35000.1 putative Zn-dependent peptidase [Salisediminibacterium halotolerans]GEL06713.1 peptidase M16 [Salisediminibacterium halotolerans]
METMPIKTDHVGRMNIHVFPTRTYKTNTIVLQLASPLKEEDASKRSVLANVLKTSTKDYPTRQALQERLEDLYGMSLSADVYKKGEWHIISIRAEIANEKYLRDTEPLTETAVQLLASLLLQPNADESGFDEAVTADEKRALKQKLASIYDDKMRYANKRLIEEMCGGEPFSVHAYGNETAIDNIDPASLYSCYREMLQNDQFDLYILGDVAEEECMRWVDHYFKDSDLLQGGHVKPPRPQLVSSRNKPQEITEQQEVQQGKLHLGYRTGIVYGDSDYFALQVFNGLFGGFPHSKLFMNVREKASLAYYAASRLETHKGLLIVMAGIAFEDENEAKSIIHAQLDAMRAGDFTEDDIAQTKAMLKNQLLEMTDSPRGRIELEYYNALSQTDLTITEWLSAIDAVSFDEIKQIGEKIQLDTVYFLRGKDGSAHESS